MLLGNFYSLNFLVTIQNSIGIMIPSALETYTTWRGYGKKQVLFTVVKL